MANVKISQLTEQTTAADNDIVAGVSAASAGTVKTKLSTIATYLAGKSETLTNKTLTSPVINTGVSGTAIDTDGTLAANSDTKLASQKAVKTFVSSMYPVGSVYISTISTNPATLFGFGTWTAFAAGRTLIGVGTSDQAFTAGATGGESNHLLTSAESGLPSHTHVNSVIPRSATNTGSTIGNVIRDNAGTNNQLDNTLTSVSANASSAHNNLQPYIVTYMWQRTA